SVKRDDCMEGPPKKFYRLSPGREVRLRYAYMITCREVVKDASGEVVALRCTYDPATRGGNAPDGRKVQATLHWVAAAESVPAEIRVYNPLFLRPDPGAGGGGRGGCWTRMMAGKTRPCTLAGEGGAPRSGEGEGYAAPRELLRLTPHLPIAAQWVLSSPARGEEMKSFALQRRR